MKGLFQKIGYQVRKRNFLRQEARKSLRPVMGIGSEPKDMFARFKYMFQLLKYILEWAKYLLERVKYMLLSLKGLLAVI